MKMRKYGRRRGLGSVYSLTDGDARATYLRALRVFGHERACALAGVGLNAACRLAAHDPAFRAARDEALNAYRFEPVEKMRQWALKQLEGDDAEAASVALRWLASNSPGVLVDPHLLKKGDNGTNMDTRRIPAHLVTRGASPPPPAVRGLSIHRLSVDAGNPSIDDNPIVGGSIDDELKRLGIGQDKPPQDGKQGTNGLGSV